MFEYVGGALRAEEQKLLRAILGGDREACAALVHENYANIYRFLLHISGNRTLAEDLTQETFAAAWDGMGAFRGEAAFGTWLHRIAYGKFVDAARRGKSESTAAEHMVRLGKDWDTADGPLEAASDREQARVISEAILRLHEDDRGIIAMHYFEGMSLREVAKVVGRPVGTVKWQTHRALRDLRALLDGRLEP